MALNTGYWLFVRDKDGITASGLMTDHNPFGSPITGAGSHKRLPVACDRKTYLAALQFIGPKEADTGRPHTGPYRSQVSHAILRTTQEDSARQHVSAATAHLTILDEIVIETLDLYRK